MTAVKVPLYWKLFFFLNLKLIYENILKNYNKIPASSIMNQIIKFSIMIVKIKHCKKV